MAEYEKVALLRAICANLTGTPGAGTAYDEIKILRGIVTAAGGTPSTPAAGAYERITLLDDWVTAVGASAPATVSYPEVERYRVIAADYGATDAGGTNYEVIRLLTAIEAAT